jgi:hypothetical protein
MWTEPASAISTAQSGATMAEGAPCIHVPVAYTDTYTSPLGTGIGGRMPGISMSGEATHSLDESQSAMHQI